MHYYEEHIGDTIKLTAHLTFLERGAFALLKSYACLTEGPFPEDVEDLCWKLMARTAHEKKIVKGLLQRLWKLEEDGWHHPACVQSIITKYHDGQEQRRLAGLKSAAQRKGNGKATGAGPPFSGGATESYDAGNHSPIPNPQEPSASSHEPGLATPPTLEAALAWAEKFSRGNAWGMAIGDEVVREWHDDRSRMGWGIPRGQHMVPIADWQADLRDFTKWKAEGRSPSGGGWQKKERVGSFNKPERPEVAVRLLTHAGMPEPPCDWRAVLRDLYPEEEYPQLDHAGVVWGLIGPDVRRDIASECRRRGVLAVDWVQMPVPVTA